MEESSKRTREDTMKLTNQELDGILQTAGLRLTQPYSPNGSYRKTDWLYTTCTRCGTEAHYRLKYILDKNAIGEPVCRACFWLAWYGWAGDIYDASVRSMIARGASREDLLEWGVIGQKHDATWAEAQALANSNGFNLVDLLHGPRLGNDVLVVRCQVCGRQTAERPEDIRFGCSCGGKKGAGVPYGHESKQPNTPLYQRDIAPRTPSAASFNAWLAKNSPDPDERSKAQAIVEEISNSGTCLRETNPELAEEWLEAKDGPSYTPDTVKSGSKRKVTWRCIACGYEWCDSIHNRELRRNNRCPNCGKVMGSLAWKHPELAREWSPANPISPWNTKPFGQLDFVPKWVCPNNPQHVWSATVASRLKGKGCPFCG
jgi:hypothetical protein